jgi:hypothetical protein
VMDSGARDRRSEADAFFSCSSSGSDPARQIEAVRALNRDPRAQDSISSTECVGRILCNTPSDAAHQPESGERDEGAATGDSLPLPALTVSYLLCCWQDLIRGVPIRRALPACQQGSPTFEAWYEETRERWAVLQDRRQRKLRTDKGRAKKAGSIETSDQPFLSQSQQTSLSFEVWHRQARERWSAMRARRRARAEKGVDSSVTKVSTASTMRSCPSPLGKGGYLCRDKFSHEAANKSVEYFQKSQPKSDCASHSDPGPSLLPGKDKGPWGARDGGLANVKQRSSDGRQTRCSECVRRKRGLTHCLAKGHQSLFPRVPPPDTDLESDRASYEPTFAAVDRTMEDGTLVEVLFDDGVWYAGRVVRVRADAARQFNLVRFADGFEDAVPLRSPDIRRPLGEAAAAAAASLTAADAVSIAAAVPAAVVAAARDPCCGKSAPNDWGESSAARVERGSEPAELQAEREGNNDTGTRRRGCSVKGDSDLWSSSKQVSCRGCLALIASV